MARKPTLSPSKITTYLACPVKYRWTYLDDRGKWYLRSKSYYSFGTSLHRVLQRFHDAADVGVTTTHQAIAALEESWIDAGYRNTAEMQEAMGDGKAIIESYIDRIQSEPATAETLYIEKQFRLDLGSFILIGRLDRVDRRADGTLEIVDYKSGRQGVTPEEIAHDIAMGCYQILLSDKHPLEPVGATIVALRSGARASYSFSTEERDAFRQDIVALGNEILSRNFEELAPVPKPLCLGCDFVKLCSQDREFSLSEVIPLEAPDPDRS